MRADPPARFAGRYQLLRRLACGGMAEIFLARSLTAAPSRQVVIKRILPQLAAQDEFVEMFLSEARIAGMLRHGNIVRTYEFGMAEGGYFISMELLDGMTLRRLCNAHHRRALRIPRSAAIEIVRAVCAALHYAHERVDTQGRSLGIVHRDVTPHNVIVTRSGAVKLLDFGIAKSAAQVTQTRPNAIKGKVGYMSPEQARGSAERRSDVFAAGLLLYELTLGQRAYRADDEGALFAQMMTGRYPPPRSVDPDYPATLEGILDRALARRVEDRYETAAALDADLARAAWILDATARPGELGAMVSEIADDLRTIEALEREEDLSPSIELVLDPDTQTGIVEPS